VPLQLVRERAAQQAAVSASGASGHELARVARTLSLPTSPEERNTRLLADLRALAPARLRALVPYMRNANDAAVAAFVNMRLPVSLGVPAGTVVPPSLEVQVGPGASAVDVDALAAVRQYFALHAGSSSTVSAGAPAAPGAPVASVSAPVVVSAAPVAAAPSSPAVAAPSATVAPSASHYETVSLKLSI